MPTYKVTFLEETISKVERFEVEVDAPNEEEARKVEHWRMKGPPVKVLDAPWLAGTQRRTVKVEVKP